MNEYMNTRQWYLHEDLVSAVNACLKALEMTGITAEHAVLVPQCLERAIRCSNDQMLSETAFKSVPVSVTERDCSYEVTPRTLGIG